MELLIEENDLFFLSQNFDFKMFLADNYEHIFPENWEKIELEFINFNELSLDEMIFLNEIFDKSNSIYITFFPFKEGIPKYKITKIDDIIFYISQDLFYWFEPLLLFSDTFIIINEPDIEKCFIGLAKAWQQPSKTDKKLYK